MMMNERRRALMASNTNKPTELSGVWGSIYVERVTVNGATASNMIECGNVVANARTDKTGTVIAIRRYNPDSPSPAYNEFGGVIGEMSTLYWSAKRYRSGWGNTMYNTAYDGTISDGSVFDVISMRYTSL